MNLTTKITSSMGSGQNNSVNTLALCTTTTPPRMYFGGVTGTYTTHIGYFTLNGAFTFTGLTGTSSVTTITSMCCTGTHVFVTGTFTQISGLTVTNVCKFDVATHTFSTIASFNPTAAPVKVMYDTTTSQVAYIGNYTVTGQRQNITFFNSTGGGISSPTTTLSTGTLNTGFCKGGILYFGMKDGYDGLNNNVYANTGTIYMYNMNTNAWIGTLNGCWVGTYSCLYVDDGIDVYSCLNANANLPLTIYTKNYYEIKYNNRVIQRLYYNGDACMFNTYYDGTNYFSQSNKLEGYKN